MARMPPFPNPKANPELDRLVRDLDRKLDQDFLAEMKPTLDRLPARRDLPLTPAERAAPPALSPAEAVERALG